jgi:xanthine dehydrogenase YagR molybdenum-binding subunit
MAIIGKNGTKESSYPIHTYGVHFADVGVDADTGEIRHRQILGVFSPARILNAKTARF